MLIVIAVLLFCLIVFIHEMGHFITAKLCGIQVNEFALGMGPRLFHFKKGETTYSLRLLPIGGFCAMEGENGDSENPRAFGNKPVWKRLIVVSAGAIMNLLLGFVFMIILMVQQPVFASTTIAYFYDGAATQQAGMQLGDTFYSVNGYRIYTDRDLSFALSTADPASVDFVLLRDGEKVVLDDVALQTRDADGTPVTVVDFKVDSIPKNVGTVLWQSAAGTISNIRMVWSSLFGILTGQISPSSLAGPVGTASVISQAASQGLSQGFGEAVNNILLVMVIITVNLGIVNLFPLPALDGGRLVFLIIEGIRRKPINRKYEGWIHAGGFVLLMGFMVLISINDIVRIFS